MSILQTEHGTSEFKVRADAGVDLQPYIDTIHLAAVETLRSIPNAQIVAAGRRALKTVIEHSRHSSQTAAILDVAHMTEEAFEAALAVPAEHSVRVGHHVAAIVADLSRTVDALDRHDDPSSIVTHARSLLNSVPRGEQQHDLIEIDLNDRDQLARLLEASTSSGSSTPASGDVASDTTELRARFTQFAGHAEQLLESAEDVEMIDRLLESLVALQTSAAENGIEDVGRVVACAVRVVESHRSAGESLPLDAVELLVACRRIIPMILERLDDPSSVSHAVDALVDQSTFVLMELRRGTRPLGNLWPEPDDSEYQAIARAETADSFTVPDHSCQNGIPKPAPFESNGATVNGRKPDESTPSAGEHSYPAVDTAALEASGATIRVPVDVIEDLMQRAGELAVRSGGSNQRARKVLGVSQDINSIADRLRYLVRAWNDGKYREDDVRHQLSEITADLGLASSDLEHTRIDQISVAQRQSDVRARLDESIARLRSVPLKMITDPLIDFAANVAREFSREVQLRVEGASTTVDALHAEALSDALQQLVLNAVEHGIEHREIRERGGKSRQGLIRIRATRDGSQTVIHVIDDGAGIDPSEVLRKAEAAGYRVPQRGVTRDRVLQYIFFPGFTTREGYTAEDSGTGLDRVSDAVSGASGSVIVHSEPGSGTAFTLRLPVTSMEMQATIVSVSSERYAIPAAQIEVVQSSRVEKVESRVDGYHARVDGDMLPATDLGALLNVRSHHHVQNEHGTYLRVSYDNEQWLLRVDRVQEPEAVSLLPLGREFHHITGAVGSTVLASGESALVLDIAQVLDTSNRRGRRSSRQTASLTRVPFALVTDDSTSVRRELCAYLENDGWRVVEARDAFEARELLETVAPDLVVVDLDLPAHGGFQIAHAARNRSHMPVIGLSSRDDPDVHKRAESLTIDAHLFKPLDPDQLKEILERISSEQQDHS
jgi:chemotaxis protein histidine kinase CheA/ActR/RegA family two-component response regulator